MKSHHGPSDHTSDAMQPVDGNAVLSANSETLPSLDTAFIVCNARQRSSNEGLGIHREARANCVAQCSAWQGSLWASNLIGSCAQAPRGERGESCPEGAVQLGTELQACPLPRDDETCHAVPSCSQLFRAHLPCHALPSRQVVLCSHPHLPVAQHRSWRRVVGIRVPAQVRLSSYSPLSRTEMRQVIIPVPCYSPYRATATTSPRPLVVP